jgi:phytoene dehydrogenase-like protein
MSKSAKVVVVGGGMCGLVVANVLTKAGHHVTVLERTPFVGGATRKGIVIVDGRRMEYPLGATLFGHMPRFLFDYLGLDKRVMIGVSPHASEYQFLSDKRPICPFDPEHGLADMRNAWGETGDIDGFDHDCGKVITFLRSCYQAAVVPTLEMAHTELGSALVKQFITGDVKSLVNTYLTSEKMKVIVGGAAVENGPTGLTEPWSAFSIALSDTGDVQEGGRWGYVKGGIWQITDSLAEINRELGVVIRTNCTVQDVDMSRGRLRCESPSDLNNGEVDGSWIDFDHLVFATDPVTAARCVGGDLVKTMETKRWLGTSGKLIALFKEPVRWKYDTGRNGYDSANKFLFETELFDEIDRGSQAVSQGLSDFFPGRYEFYCHGAGNRLLGHNEGGDAVMMFFKHMSDRVNGDEHGAREQIIEILKSRIANPDALIWSRLLTPKDLMREFFLPRGNIEHAMLCEGQTFFSRTYSTEPEKAFYRFGPHANVWYCGSGAFPGGNVDGTPGWMAGKEFIRHNP